MNEYAFPLFLLVIAGGAPVAGAGPAAASVVEIGLAGSDVMAMGEGVIGWFGEPLFTLNGSAVTASGLLRALLVFLLVVVVSRFLQRLLRRFSQRQKSINEAAVYTVECQLPVADSVRSCLWHGQDAGKKSGSGGGGQDQPA